MGLPERQIEEIELAGMLHDIGKIGVEDQILMKPARLDPHEQELMRRHPISELDPRAFGIPTTFSASRAASSTRITTGVVIPKVARARNIHWGRESSLSPTHMRQ